MEKRRKPIIGFAGMCLMALGLVCLCGSANWGWLLVIAGAAILVGALFTGNVKMLG